MGVGFAKLKNANIGHQKAVSLERYPRLVIMTIVYGIVKGIVDVWMSTLMPMVSV